MKHERKAAMEQPFCKPGGSASRLRKWARSRSAARVELLGQSDALVVFDQKGALDLVTRQRQVALRMSSHLLVFVECQVDPPKAALIAALAEERDRKAPAELTTLLGDPIVRAAKDFLDLRCGLPSSRATFPTEALLTLAYRGPVAENRAVGEREERLAGNEALFREVNERIAEVVEHFVEVESTADPAKFNCECGNPTCTEQVAMTLVEYEAVRAVPTHFAVVAGHELPEIEQIVERHPNYLVVEKQEEDAEQVARETDPRTDPREEGPA